MHCRSVKKWGELHSIRIPERKLLILGRNSARPTTVYFIKAGGETDETGDDIVSEGR